jgi:manganese efflux pump family protein
MSPAELIGLGAAIGANNLAVSLTLGSLGQARRRWRIVAVFGVFEFTLPLIGLLIGRETADALAGSGRWLGAALLAALGLWTLRPSEDPGEDERLARHVTTWRGLAGLAAVLSIDNLVVGFALGLGSTGPLLLAGVIAVFAVCFTLIGLELGAAGRRRWSRGARVASGTALLALAIAIATGWLD